MRDTFLSILFLVFFFSNGFSQNKNKPIQDWEIGLFLGAGLLSGDLVTDAHSFNASGQPAIGVSFHRNLNTSIAIRANILYTNLKSDDAKSDVAEYLNRGFSHETKLTELSLVAQWDFLGNRRFRMPGEFKKIITPYIFAGVGFAYGLPETNYNGLKTGAVLADQNADKEYRMAYPIGGGLKLELSRNFSISLEAGFRPTFNDLLDGVSQSGNPNQDDWYNFSGVILNYRFGKTDYDSDGLIDILDACPGEYGNKDFGQGCPDKDGDFIVDALDECPDVPGKRVLKGCPDLDHDGVPDKRDLCPNDKGLFKFLGCPDSDNDDVIDGEDLCPDIAGPAEFYGCPDSDNDGIIDKNDECPNIAGIAELNGCNDSDQDGISDNIDECPNSEGFVTLNGCPDKDGDGIIDKNDECPNEFGTAENGGCKGIKKSDKEILLASMRNLKFKTGNYYLTQNAKNELNNVLNTFIQYPDYELVIRGYTDSVGKSKINQQLSEKRARSCYRYLIEKGVEKNRLSYYGLGEKNPIAANSTKEGREENRRVEFELVEVPKK